MYLTHVASENGKGGSIIANAIHDAIKDTELEMTLTTVGSDGTAVMTGEHSGFIRILEELLGRPLQWSICLLHCNELPLRHVFAELDGATSGPDSFSGKIGSQLSGSVSECDIVKFDQLFPPISPLFPQMR